MKRGDTNLNVEIKRGDVFLCDMSLVKGSEQGGTRPVVVIQNNVGNRFSPTIIVCAITAQIQKAKLPTHTVLSAEKYGFPKDSVVLGEQLRTIDKSRLLNKLTTLDSVTMKRIDAAIMISLGMAG